MREATVCGPCSLFLLALAASLYALTAMGAEPIKRAPAQLSLGPYTFDIEVPAGYKLEHLSSEMSAPRLLTFHANGDLFAGSRAGFIYRIPPPYTAPEVLIKLQGYPHNVAFRDGEILIARTDGLYRAPYVAGQRQIKPEDVTPLASVPGGPGHDTRTVRVGPDGKIYLSLGIRGNCSDDYLDSSYPEDRRRGGLMVLDESTVPPAWRPFASGLRNPVGFDWHPQTRVAYASNNGPDHLGYEQPPEVFARLSEGSFHGMPWFQPDGKALQRDACAPGNPPRLMSQVQAPAATFPPRNAPMDVAFVRPGTFDVEFEGDAVVALKGSWGTAPSGGADGDPATRRHPKLVLVRFEKGAPIQVDDLVTGFQLPDGHRWARPVGVAFGPDKALYFTSDSAIEGLYRLMPLKPGS